MRRLLSGLLLGLALGAGSGCGEARADQPAPAPARPVPAADQASRCPVCKHEVPLDAKYCLRCGSRLR